MFLSVSATKRVINLQSFFSYLKLKEFVLHLHNGILSSSRVSPGRWQSWAACTKVPKISVFCPPALINVTAVASSLLNCCELEHKASLVYLYVTFSYLFFSLITSFTKFPLCNFFIHFMKCKGRRRFRGSAQRRQSSYCHSASQLAAEYIQRLLSVLSQGMNVKEVSYNSEIDLPEIPAIKIVGFLSKLKYNWKKKFTEWLTTAWHHLWGNQFVKTLILTLKHKVLLSCDKHLSCL